MVGLSYFAPLGGGLFLGWSLGANDAANVFGTAVGSRIISFRRAAVICSVFVILGAVLQGSQGMETLSGITKQSIGTAVIVSVAAAITGTIMTFLKIPISTSQAVVGAILGIGLATGNVQYGGLVKVVLCWIGTPLGAMAITIVLYATGRWLTRVIPMNMLTRDKVLWAGLTVVGAYGSYALGANNVANTTGMFSGLLEGADDRMLSAIGGVAIAIGVLTYSKRVMMNVGKGVMTLDAYTAFVAVLSMSLTVHIFAMVGVPVSTSQGIIGSILGIGLFRGTQALHFRPLRDIALGWVATPITALILAAAGYAIFL